ncbi:hypothetical protein ACV3SO_13785 [Clostridium perfringens]|nr:hypothetical protein [Clostridium perfringens]MDM0964130.1 hypothetical protein [Clostridium perfringens]
MEIMATLERINDYERENKIQPKRSYEKPNNERLLPTESLFLEDKRFSYGLWMYLQSISKGNNVDGYRYVNIRDIKLNNLINYIFNLTKDKERDCYLNKKISKPTLKKALNYLKEIGLIIDVVDGKEVMGGYKGKYYRIKNRFKRYVLMENDYLKILLRYLSQDSIKVYLLYYSFSNQYGESICFLNQETILERIGLSASGQNFKKLWHINNELEKFGLITKYQEIYKREGREFKRKNIIKANWYWETELYHIMQKELYEKGEITDIESEIIRVI